MRTEDSVRIYIFMYVHTNRVLWLKAGLCHIYLTVRGTSDPGAFFVKSDRQQVIKPHFVMQLRKALAAVGLHQAAYAGHCFRIGAATAAGVLPSRSSEGETAPLFWVTSEPRVLSSQRSPVGWHIRRDVIKYIKTDSVDHGIQSCMYVWRALSGVNTTAIMPTA